jgi:hydroxyacylglutathione hydrolase
MEESMEARIVPIHFGGMLGYGVNCFLIAAGPRFILIDTGTSPNRPGLEEELRKAGCEPGRLELIVLTHGHGDHTGNCAYLREKYGAKIAMHRGDLKIVEGGHVETGPVVRLLVRLIGLMAGVGESEPFAPDICLDEGQGLSDYGFDAKVLHLPGHSEGSIGILTAEGDLFCGDIFVNKSKPARHAIVTDAAAFDASVERLKAFGIRTVYPGHGRPFPMSRIAFRRNTQD